MTFAQKTFFYLVQSELGDLYKITMDLQGAKNSEKFVSNIQIQYFDTIPTAVSICIFKTGFLFAACEYGDQ